MKKFLFALILMLAMGSLSLAQDWPALLFDPPGSTGTVFLRLVKTPTTLIVQRIEPPTPFYHPPSFVRLRATLLRQEPSPATGTPVTMLNSIWCVDAENRRVVVSVMASKTDRSGDTGFPSWHYAEVGNGVTVLPPEPGCKTVIRYVPAIPFTDLVQVGVSELDNSPQGRQAASAMVLK